ncbi:protein NRT1/ PTR FAMILY 2.13-like [Senna tora]|uniref:Protein NRT1/ PTR FAMILY 2.13-like n=1 Tax=Senna tora TaxID=362788 RepID=A0A834SSR7_9FABA|nr:protein NRT1/ PTR FAMILY 2.13-like [Senna tora]
MATQVKGTNSSSSTWSLLFCRSCISSTSSADKEESPEKLSRSSLEAASSTQKKNKPGGWRAITFILGISLSLSLFLVFLLYSFFIWLAVFGLFANFMVYLTRELHLDQVHASNIMNIWFGVTNFAPLLGAYISDAYVGRFKTIACASFASLLGMLVVTLTAWLPKLHPSPCTPQQLVLNQCEKASNLHLGVLLLGLVFLTIGSAGIRPCSIPFGVDQFDPTTKEGKKGINSFFNWYYVTFTVVLLITQTVVIYIQDSVSWKIGFGIPTIFMFFSIIMFFVGTKIYVHVKPEGSIFSGMAQVLVAAYKKRHVQLPPSEEKIDGVFYDPPLMGSAALSKLPLTDQFRSLNKACMILEGELNPDGTRVNKWRLTSIQQVEEVKCIARIFPIWAAGILSLTSMAQQGTFTVSQALKMDRHLGPNFQIPAGSIGVISFLTIGVWIPIYDRVLVPSLRNFTKHEGGITLLQRIGIGMVFSIFSMVAAGLIEKTRRDSANANPNPLGIAPMSVMWLAPQLILMGMCEAFNIIGQIEFFNRQFPEHMRSVANSLFSVSFAVANYVSTILVTAVHGSTRTEKHRDWLTNNINEGRLDYFYYLIAVIAAVNLVYFLYVAQRFRYKGNVNVIYDDDYDHDHDVELASRKELDAN